jgi:hypothetical protein
VTEKACKALSLLVFPACHKNKPEFPNLYSHFAHFGQMTLLREPFQPCFPHVMVGERIAYIIQ